MSMSISSTGEGRPEDCSWKKREMLEVFSADSILQTTAGTASEPMGQNGQRATNRTWDMCHAGEVLQDSQEETGGNRSDVGGSQDCES